MLTRLKEILYFPIAYYFRFFASIRLRRWHPRILVVTGSNGKTTLLHLLESQIGRKAKFSHHANSSFGIPFDVLGLERKTLQRSEWIRLFLLAPVRAFVLPPKQNLYIVEADADRPGEGKFLSEFLQPEIVLWISTSQTHAMNYDSLVQQNKFHTVGEAIAYEYGYFAQNCSQLLMVNGDIPAEHKEISRTLAKVRIIKKENELQKYHVHKEGTAFTINRKTYSFKALLPEEIFYSIVMCKEAVEYLGLPFDPSFSAFELPPGRGSIFNGIKDLTLIDSTYNANLASMAAMLEMYTKFPNNKKWVVLSDMLELGNVEKEEHEKLATILSRMQLENIILLGPRMREYTAPKLQRLLKSSEKVIPCLNLGEVHTYIKNTISGGEAIFFKGSQSMMLEAVLELFLKDREDGAKLPRRQKFWKAKLKNAGL